MYVRSLEKKSVAVTRLLQVSHPGDLSVFVPLYTPWFIYDIHIRRNDLQEKDLYLSVICMLDTDFSGYDKAVEVDAHKFHFEAGNRTMFLPKTSNLFNRSHIVNSKICTIVFPPASASSASTTELDNVYYRITCTCS
ncbi:ORF284 [White spot syndrome virus]|uniref:ORF284 n=1 Tax=White spot syndrome virus TaxID=342409 RepID=A0A2D3I570_9VIRU|nr:ORF284 [White spot syndrome virus]